LVRAKLDCRLIILGEGSERRHLEELVEQLGLREQVLLPGHRSNPFAYMRRAALFVLTSRFEGSPNVLIEALAVGVPVVATDCHSGPREILEHGTYGPLVPVGDAKQMAEAILTTLANPLPAETLQRAVTRFDADTVAGQYVEIFQEILKG
jgi:glycosyltransferase involved in cell wall biosynthesis